MSVRKRVLPSGEVRWQVDYRDKQGKEGKRRSRQFRTQKEAKDYETTVRGEIKAGVHVADSASSKRLASFGLPGRKTKGWREAHSSNTAHISTFISLRLSAKRSFRNSRFPPLKPSEMTFSRRARGLWCARC